MTEITRTTLPAEFLPAGQLMKPSLFSGGERESKHCEVPRHNLEETIQLPEAKQENICERHRFSTKTEMFSYFKRMTINIRILSVFHTELNETELVPDK